METSDFKKMFGEVSKENGFERAYEGWFRESPEVILVLDLQKSNFGNYYYLNIKLFIQGAFGNAYSKSKKLVKSDVGNIFLRQPDNYSNLLDLDAALEDSDRKNRLRKMFKDFIVPGLALCRGRGVSGRGPRRPFSPPAARRAARWIC